MRFRKRRLAKINIAFTNGITELFAGWLSGLGTLTHLGQKSGKVYRTPINVFQASSGFIIALTYSSLSEGCGRLRIENSREDTPSIPDSGARRAEDRGCG